MKSQFNSLNDSRNQFINQQTTSPNPPNNQLSQNQDLQKMFLMFQKMATDPSIFMKMMNTVRQPQPQLQQRRRQFQVQQHKYRNHEVSPRRKDLESSPVSKQQVKNKPKQVVKRYNVNENDNVLQKYFSSQSQPAQNLSQSTVTISTKEQHFQKLQDKPIQSSYANNAIKQKNQFPAKKTEVYQQMPSFKTNPDDDRPIKPAKGFTYQGQLNQSVLANNSMAQPVNPSKYKEAEQRPIKGIQGDFKNYVMKQGGFPVSQYPADQNQEDQDQQNTSVPKARTFLKRGSRQHLSSAMDKSAQKPKPNKGIANTKQQLDMSSSNLKEQKDERSISQNRLLGRKSISAKSISKKQPSKNLKEQQQKKPMQYSNTTSNYSSINNQANKNTEGNKTPRSMQRNQVNKNKNRNNRRQDSSSPTFQAETPPVEVKKQKKKNIFQESSSDEQNQNKVTKMPQNNKNQVIPGVFLSKKQLHQIITRYSKSTPPTINSSQSQIQELKAKYIDLCNILAQQKQIFEVQMQKQKEQFQAYKNAQIAKIKNQKKVQERNLLNNQKNKEKQREKQEFQTLRKIYQKEKEQWKHKQRNYKIMVEKYKKITEEKQKFSAQEQKTTTIDNKYEQSAAASKKKVRQPSVNNPGLNSGYNDEVTNNSQFKGAEQNIGYNINRKDQINAIKQVAAPTGQKQKLPNYQDLKKPNTVNPSKANGQISHQNVDKNKKYEYYEQSGNKQTSKLSKFNDDEGEQEQQNKNSYHKSDHQDNQQIVQYNCSMKLSDLTKIPLTIKMVTEEMIENLFRYQNNSQYKKYLQIAKSKNRAKIHTNRNAAQKKTTNIYADGGKQIIFDTGVRKQYFNNGYMIIYFTNGDIKQKLSDQTILYFFYEKEVDQITLPNKINIFRFENNQVQFHFQNNRVEIRHPDGTFKIV